MWTALGMSKGGLPCGRPIALVCPPLWRTPTVPDSPVLSTIRKSDELVHLVVNKKTCVWEISLTQDGEATLLSLLSRPFSVSAVRTLATSHSLSVMSCMEHAQHSSESYMADLCFDQASSSMSMYGMA